MIGANTRKIISSQMKNKGCAVCLRHKKGKDVPDHQCIANYDKSSKAMEPDACLEMVTNIHEESKGDVFVKSITADDDTTMKAVVSHEGNGKGRLTKNIPEPFFFCRP